MTGRLEGSERILLLNWIWSTLEGSEFTVSRLKIIPGVFQGWTILVWEMWRDGATGMGRRRDPPRERRTWAVWDVTGEMGPFSWFSSSKKFLVIDFFQCFGVEILDSSLMTRDRGSLCSSREETLQGEKTDWDLVLPGDIVDTSSESEKSNG